MLQKLIEQLRGKHNAIIGNLKDKESVVSTRNFKLGLAWAIESAETMLKQAEAEDATSQLLDELYALRCIELSNECGGLNSRQRSRYLEIYGFCIKNEIPINFGIEI